MNAPLPASQLNAPSRWLRATFPMRPSRSEPHPRDAAHSRVGQPVSDHLMVAAAHLIRISDILPEQPQQTLDTQHGRAPNAEMKDYWCGGPS